MKDYPVRVIPQRIEKLKKELMDAGTSVCYERASIATRSYKESEGEHQAIRRAKALRDIFNQIPIFIREGEFLVGQRASTLAGRSVYPEYNLTDLGHEETPPEVRAYWCGRTIGERVRRSYPERLILAESEMASGFVTGSDSGYGHVIVDYEKAIKVGFRSIIAQAEGLLAEMRAGSERKDDEEGRAGGGQKDDAEGRSFLESVVISSLGLIEWAGRYADLAAQQADCEPNPERRKELLRIADTCRRVPAEPARNLTEAMQSFWFVHMAMHIEQYGWSISAGRLDQYLFPFYQGDLDAGVLSEGQAWELLLNLWVKFMENVHGGVRDTVFQNLTLGGQDLDGRDQSNALSRMCLEAAVALRFNQPALSVRWHANIDPDFWEQVHRTLAEGMGLPALFNDEIIIRALTTHGVEHADAVGYALVGCVEASVPGKQQGMTAGGHINCAKALELALNDGCSMMTGIRIGQPTGVPSSFKSFEDLWTAYKEQIEYLCGLNILATHISGEMQKQYGHCPLMSSLLDDCIVRKRDMVFGGTRYNLSGVGVFGPANVCDGMMAIRKWVCEEKRLTWKELRQVLLDDYAGHEEIRLLFANKTPRFGNDLTEVDTFINRITAVHADFFWKQVDSRNGRYTSGVWPVTTHVGTGTWTAATPDGRHKGAPLVDGVGACQGADRNGPTALLQSVARLDNINHWTAGNTCNIKFSATGIRAGNGVDRLRDLTTTFMKLGGQELQVNIVDAGTLHDAMKNPEMHADLVIRVAGYSAYFTTLNANVQNEIISRMEQAV
jgi:pyruvate formate-lyase/glycerol dehydratase family glycyl radical enzyme